jgi:hypothetical protein
MPQPAIEHFHRGTDEGMMVSPSGETTALLLAHRNEKNERT